LETAGDHASGKHVQLGPDFRKRRRPSGLVRDIRHVYIHRQAGHVLNKQIQGRAAFHRKGAGPENIGNDIQKKPHHLHIGFVHQGFSIRVFPSGNRVSQRPFPRGPAAVRASVAQSSPSSSAHCTHNRTTFTRGQCPSRVPSTS